MLCVYEGDIDGRNLVSDEYIRCITGFVLRSRVYVGTTCISKAFCDAKLEEVELVQSVLELGELKDR